MHDDEKSKPHMVRADLLTGLFLLFLGLGIAWMSWEMPRLTTRGIHPATAPGLVPGILGMVLALCGGLLALRSRRMLADREGWKQFGRLFISTDAIRVMVAVALALVFALAFVGRMPFWAAATLFVFLFIIAFERGFRASPHPLRRTMLTAAVQAVLVGVLIAGVFQYGFLVRLP